MIQTPLQANHINNNQPTLKRKTYVLDTTVLINDPNIVSKLKGRVVIPLVVIGQLDGLKNNKDANIAQRARQASRAILEAQEKGKVRVINNFKKGVDVLGSEADNKIIGTCLTLKEQGENVNLLTTDVNMQIVAKSMEVKIANINRSNVIISKFIEIGFKIQHIMIICTYIVTASLFTIAINWIFFMPFLFGKWALYTKIVNIIWNVLEDNMGVFLITVLATLLLCFIITGCVCSIANYVDEKNGNNDNNNKKSSEDEFDIFLDPALSGLDCNIFHNHDSEKN